MTWFGWLFVAFMLLAIVNTARELGAGKVKDATAAYWLIVIYALMALGAATVGTT